MDITTRKALDELPDGAEILDALDARWTIGTDAIGIRIFRAPGVLRAHGAGIVALPARVISEHWGKPLSLNAYQAATRDTAIYPGAQDVGFEALPYLALGLTSEAGEVAGKVKKALRDEAGYVSDERRTQLLDEVGDVLWYLARLADELGEPLGAVARSNLAKLESRKERGTLGGDGDVR